MRFPLREDDISGSITPRLNRGILETAMKKKVFIFLVIISVLIAGGIGGYIFYSLKHKTNFAGLPIPLVNLPSGEEVTAGATYTDESGFSFGYPTGVKVSDVTPDDESYYSVLALAKGGSQITMTIKDTTAKTVDDWVRDGLTSSSLYGAQNLGGLSAKQYTSGQKLYTVAIDEGVLYLIEGSKDNSFWESTQNLVVSTFKIGSTASSGSSDNTVYESEDVVQ